MSFISFPNLLTKQEANKTGTIAKLAVYSFSLSRGSELPSPLGVLRGSSEIPNSQLKIFQLGILLRHTSLPLVTENQSFWASFIQLLYSSGYKLTLCHIWFSMRAVSGPRGTFTQPLPHITGYVLVSCYISTCTTSLLLLEQPAKSLSLLSDFPKK